MGNDLDLDALERLARAATPGPWSWTENSGWAYPQTHVDSSGGTKIARFVEGSPQFCCTVGEANQEWRNAAFIASANPATALDLIHRLRTAEAAIAQGQSDMLALSAVLAESRANDRAAMGWLVDARAASGDDGKRMLPEFVAYLKELRADADRYRHLEHLCATGSYGGIISRKAVDASMAAAAPKDERLALESCGCSESEQETCRGASSPFAEHPRCLRSMQQRKAASEGRPEAGGTWQPIDTAPLDQVVLLASEFDGPGDWRIKCGYFDNERGCWKVWGASWVPTRWADIPAPPGSA